MPGFAIGVFGPGGSADHPHNREDILRVHRWSIKKLGDNGDITKFAKTFTPPVQAIEAQEILGASLVYKFAKRVSWEDVTVSFYDDCQVAFDSLTEWQDMVYDPDKGFQKHSGENGYKKQAIFELLDGLGEIKRSHKLHGAWPKRIEHSEMDYSSSELKLLTVTLAYDYAETTPQCNGGPPAAESAEETSLSPPEERNAPPVGT